MPDNPEHQRVRYHRGSASGYPCVDCGDTKKYHEWSQIWDYDNNCYLDGEDIWSYEARCCACHYIYDEKDHSHLHKPEYYQGEKSSQHKLKEKDVHEIRRMLKAGHTQQYIANKFNVHQVNISSIKLGKTWGWLAEEVVA